MADGNRVSMLFAPLIGHPRAATVLANRIVATIVDRIDDNMAGIG
jgi:hypothetical protein